MALGVMTWMRTAALRLQVLRRLLAEGACFCLQPADAALNFHNAWQRPQAVNGQERECLLS